MKKVLIVLVTLLLASGVAFAAKPANPGEGGRCISAGTSLLATSGLMAAAAKQELNYAPLLGATGELFLPLPLVIGLHFTSPESFTWCN
jgi:O-antigen ligase